jgi:hypothetical protein
VSAINFATLTHFELEAQYRVHAPRASQSSQPGLILLPLIACIAPVCPNLRILALTIGRYKVWRRGIRDFELPEIFDLFEFEDKWLENGGEAIAPLALETTEKLQRVDVKLNTYGLGRGIANPDRLFEFFGRAWTKGVANLELDGAVMDWEKETRVENGVRVCAFKECIRPE